MVEPRDLGKAIQRLRGDRTQRACAERAGISASSWSLYESGDRVPRKSMRERISRGLEVDLRTLDEEAWRVRNERIAADETAAKSAAAAVAETVPDPIQNAIEEHVNGVAHHLRELALLLCSTQKPPLTP
jgi:transcriptional regulator with XRE-family HTH domain